MGGDKNVTRSNVNRHASQIKILEDEKLVCKKGKKYALTELGELIAHFLDRSTKHSAFWKKKRNFGRIYDINALPKEFLLRVGEASATSRSWKAETRRFTSPTKNSGISWKIPPG